MTPLEGTGLAIGVFALVAPNYWPTMHKNFNRLLVIGGVLLLAYSGLGVIQEWFEMTFSKGPMALYFLGAVLIGTAALWQLETKPDPSPEKETRAPVGTLKLEDPEAVVEAERIFVGKEITPRYLLNLYRDNSGIQADKLAKVYIGKWIELNDELGDVLSLDSGGAQVSFEPCADVTDWYCYTLTAMYFDKKWTDRLSILKPGAKITVIGQIRSIAATRLVLDNSELKL